MTIDHRGVQRYFRGGGVAPVVLAVIGVFFLLGAMINLAHDVGAGLFTLLIAIGFLFPAAVTITRRSSARALVDDAMRTARAGALADAREAGGHSVIEEVAPPLTVSGFAHEGSRGLPFLLTRTSGAIFRSSEAQVMVLVFSETALRILVRHVALARDDPPQDSTLVVPYRDVATIDMVPGGHGPLLVVALTDGGTFANPVEDPSQLEALLPAVRRLVRTRSGGQGP